MSGIRIAVMAVCIGPGLFTSPLSYAAVSPDSSIAAFQKAHSKSLGEKIFAFPGKAIYFPLKYTMRGLNWTIGYVDDSKIPARIDDFLTSDDGLRGVQPTYSSRVGIGFRFYQNALFGDDKEYNQFSISISTWDLERQQYCLDLEDFQIIGKMLTGGLSTGYVKLTEEPFYGIGIDTQFDDESTYTKEQTFAEATFGYHPAGNFKLECRFGTEFVNTMRGLEEGMPSTTTLYDSQTLPGLCDQVELFHTMLGMVVDTRDRPGNPTKGFDAEVSGGFFTEVGDDRFGYWQFNFDATRYVHLFYERVLAVRIAAQRNDPLEDRGIPFYNLAELGEHETIRGFKRGRYRDRDMLLGSLEYRWPIWRSWDDYGVDFLIFGDVGQVTPDLLEEFEVDNFKPGIGGGIRFWGEEALILRLEAGHSEDGWRF
ncbi:outer membrane protein assembly factor [bacterium]|nr:outer membrane protein assembly factor [bacterium]